MRSLILVPIDQLEEKENRFEPLDKKMFEDLVESIRKHGVLQPLHVVKENGKYLIEDGRQRFTAAQFLDLKELPCIVESEETALGAEFDLNLFRRHLTNQEIKKYAHMKIEVEAQKRPILIPEFEMLREALPPETLKAISRWPAETQKRVYRSLPVKYVEDPKLVEEYEKKFNYLSSQLDLKTSELAQLQKMVEQYKRKNEEYEALKKTKKEKFEQMLELKKREIEEELRGSLALNEAEIATKLEERKKELEEEFTNKYEKAVEEYRAIAENMSKERAELEKKVLPLEEAKKQIEKDKKQLEEHIKQKSLEMQYANDNLKRLLEAEKFPERIKTITKDIQHTRERLVSLNDHLIRTGDVIQEQREQLLKAMGDLTKEATNLQRAVSDIEKYIK